MSDAIPLPLRPNLAQYRKLAKDFQAACESDDPRAIREWAGRFGSNAERTERRWINFRKPPCKLAGAQFFIAREHGFATWPKFAKHIEALSSDGSSVANFEAAADSIIAGDDAVLKRLLNRNPELARERSTREHRSTLLHYVSANGVEDFRQKTPPNILEITKILLDAGADVNAESDAYGGGSTALGLVATSVHPEQAGVQIDLLQVLLDRGAGIPPGSLRSCLANGQPVAAEFLASRGGPVDFEEGAGLGRLDEVERGFDSASKVQKEAGLRFACGYGRKEVVAFLLERGVAPDAACLHWASYRLNVSTDGPERERCREVLAMLATARGAT